MSIQCFTRLFQHIRADFLLVLDGVNITGKLLARYMNLRYKGSTVKKTAYLKHNNFEVSI